MSVHFIWLFVIVFYFSFTVIIYLRVNGERPACRLHTSCFISEINQQEEHYLSTKPLQIYVITYFINHIINMVIPNPYDIL